MPASDPSCLLTVHAAAAPAIHGMTLVADSEPLLLARVLQKFAVPDITILEVRCTADEASHTATVGLRFRTTPARAHLTVLKLKKVHSVRSVALDTLAG